MPSTNPNSQKPIGIYDSGLGGLTVLKALKKQFPSENFIYFADTANLPYGNKSPEEIIRFSRNIIRWMQDDLKVKMVIAGCNTSSALALEHIVPEFQIPIVGTIVPTVNAILKAPICSKIGIIATPSTTQSKHYHHMLVKAGFTGHIESISCPEFVPLIEAGEQHNPKLENIAQLYLKPFHDLQLDTLIYGCSHYPWISHVIEPLLPHSMTYINPADHITQQVEHLLSQHQLYHLGNPNPNVQFYASANPNQFENMASQLLKQTITVNHKHFAEIN